MGSCARRRGNVINLLTIDALLLVLYFITPGIVALWMHDQIIPSEKRNWNDMAFGLLSYGGLNLLFYTLLTPVIHHFFPVLTVPTILSKKALDSTSLIFIDLVFPVVVGFISGVLKRSRWIQKLFLGLLLLPDPTPWDYVFSDHRKCYGVLFRLKNGNMIGGIYERGSYVSTFPQPKEMYLKKVCTVSEQGVLLDVIPGSGGVLISMEECSFVELFDIPNISERNSLWQKIQTRLATRRTKWSRRHRQRLNEKDKVRLSKQTLATFSPSAGVATSSQILPLQEEDKKELPVPQPQQDSKGIVPLTPQLVPQTKETPTSGV